MSGRRAPGQPPAEVGGGSGDDGDVRGLAGAERPDDPGTVGVGRPDLEGPGGSEPLGHRVDQVARERRASSRPGCSRARGRHGGSPARASACRARARPASRGLPACARPGRPAVVGHGADRVGEVGGAGHQPLADLARLGLARARRCRRSRCSSESYIVAGLGSPGRRLVGDDAVQQPGQGLGVEGEVGHHVGAGPVREERGLDQSSPWRPSTARSSRAADSPRELGASSRSVVLGALT